MHFLPSAQQTVTGTVTSQPDGLPLLGVNILVKGTAAGVTTDIDGKYRIDVPNETSVLVFSYLGFLTKEVPAGSKTIINVALDEDASQLDEVFVVGYGTTRKSDITGAVSSVKSEALNAFPVLDAEQALQGRAAGVSVQTNNGGEPGAPINVTVRG